MRKAKGDKIVNGTPWSYTQLDFSVGHIQLDSSQTKAKYPVAIESLPEFLGGGKEIEEIDDQVLSDEMRSWWPLVCEARERGGGSEINKKKRLPMKTLGN